MVFNRRRVPKHLILEQPYHKQKSNGVIWILLSIITIIGSMIVSLNAKAATFNKLDKEQLFFNNNQALLHLHSDAEIKSNGVISHVTLTQSFINDTDMWQEGIYTFPFPEHSTLRHMEIHIGDKIIIGTAKEKQQARAIYQAAKEAGKKSAITEQWNGKLLTQKVANIGPKKNIVIVLRYTQKITDNNNFTPKSLAAKALPRNISDSTPAIIFRTKHWTF